jgi:hypothetical protein
MPFAIAALPTSTAEDRTGPPDIGVGYQVDGSRARPAQTSQIAVVAR